MFTRRWEKIISERNDFDIVSAFGLDSERASLIEGQVEIVSWNDYGESHYLGPVVPGATPFDASRGDSDWATGFDHTGWSRRCV